MADSKPSSRSSFDRGSSIELDSLPRVADINDAQHPYIHRPDPVQLTPDSMEDRNSWLSNDAQSQTSTRGRRESSVREFELPPVDGGFRAWSFLAASYVLEILVWGAPLANGVFLEYYERELFPQSKSNILPLIGSLASGLNYMLALPTMSYFVAYPRHRRPAMFAGLVLCIAGLLGASFSKTPVELLITQGLVLSTGGSIMYWAASTYLWEWFVEKRGLAVGILFSGTGLGGFVIPLLIDKLLRTYGYETTLRAMAVAFAVLVSAVTPFIKGRVPDSQTKAQRNLTFGFLKKRSFWFLLVISLVQGCGGYSPQLYLPTFATSALGLSSFQGTLVLALMNFSNGFGYPLFGHFSDKHLNLGVAIASILSVLSAFLLWGFSISFPVLIVFALLYGFVTPSYGAFWSGFTHITQGNPSETVLVFSVFVASRGAGNLGFGFLAPLLLSSSTGSSFAGAKGAFGLEDGKWGVMIVFTGVCAVVGGLASLVSWIPKGEKEKEMDEARAI